MSDKPGLICPICNEGLATFETTAKAKLVVKCLSCEYEFPFMQAGDGVWCMDSTNQWNLVSPIKCGNACAWTEPYGWVPEDGCPVHDDDLEEDNDAISQPSGL